MPMTQDDRLLSISTPLGKDFFLIDQFKANESLSELFTIDVVLLHEEKDFKYKPTVVNPQTLLGQGVTITVDVSDGTSREFSGIVNKFTQGKRDVNFSHYYISIVPHIWLLTQIKQSRIFQQKSVAGILKEVFDGFEVKFELLGTLEPRNYCVQYRETDFDFASRLMEEEGFYYYFEHSGGKDLMIVANTPQSHRDCPSKDIIPFYVNQDGDSGYTSSVSSFLNDYNLQTGKVTLRDYNFQLPNNKLEKENESCFTFGGNKTLEFYDYPGGYARKYDGITKSGAEQSAEISKLFNEREKIVKNTMEAIDAKYATATAYSDSCSITAGYRFALSNHPNNELNRQYVIVTASHIAEQYPKYTSSDVSAQPYTNTFTCITYGAGQPGFRPLPKTAKPIIHGSQTAMVVGPASEEIFTDKFGRVKVQFNWDREGKDDESSSCWIRVSQSWAGNQWGTMFIPRVGMEVLVHFLEGDPDQPIITGCVYNPQTMPPYNLPQEKTKSTLKSNSSIGGEGFNEFRFEDKKGKEQIFIHGEKDLDVRIKHNRRELIGNDRHLIVKRDKKEKIDRDSHIIIDRDRLEKVERDYHRKIGGKIVTKTEGTVSNDITGNVAEKFGGNVAMEISGNYTLKANTIVLEAQTGLTIKVGGNFVTINAAGVQVNGTMVLLNSGGAALPSIPGTIIPILDPAEAEIADNADPGSDAPTYKNQQRKIPPAIAPSYINPTHKPKSLKNQPKKSWIEIELLDDDGNPVPGEPYRVTLPDGSTIAEGTTDEKGYAKVTNIDPGNCKVTFPRLDKNSWDKK